MSLFQIFSDGAADIPNHIVKQYHICVIPFYVSLDQKNYQKELVELPLSTFYKNMIEQNLFPKEYKTKKRGFNIEKAFDSNRRSDCLRKNRCRCFASTKNKWRNYISRFYADIS